MPDAEKDATRTTQTRASGSAESDATVLVTVMFRADPGITADEAYDAAEAMVTAAPAECAVLTFEGIETRILPPVGGRDSEATR